MQDFIETAIHYILLAVVAILFFFMMDETLAADYSQYKQLSMPNEAGGLIVLTLEECKLGGDVKKEYPNRSYATEPNGILHEGCWDSPSIDNAPTLDPRVMTIIPLVNILWHTGDLIIYQQREFKPTVIENTDNSI